MEKHWGDARAVVPKHPESWKLTLICLETSSGSLKRVQVFSDGDLRKLLCPVKSSKRTVSGTQSSKLGSLAELNDISSVSSLSL